MHTGNLYIGTSYNWEKGFVSELLTGGGGFPVIQPTNGVVVALATASTGDLYVGTYIDSHDPVNELDFWGPKGGPVVFLQLGFTAAGIAVDIARGRVYLSTQQGNQFLSIAPRGRYCIHPVITPEYARRF